MKKTGKKLFAATMAAALALTPVMSAVSVAADDPDSIAATLLLSANGGEFQGGDIEKTIPVYETLVETGTMHTPNLDENGDRISTDPVGMQPESATQLISDTVLHDGHVYSLSRGKVEGAFQPGGIYTLKVEDEEGTSLLPDGYDPYSVTTIDSNVSGQVNAAVIPGTPEQQELDTNQYYGHYVKGTGYYATFGDVTLEEPFREGATFRGWTEDLDLENEWDPESASMRDHILYAMWDLTNFSISYDLDGGQLPEGTSNPDTYTVEDTVTLTNPVKDGFTFTGWAGTGLDAPSTDVAFGPGAAGDRVYTATWQEIVPESWAITYNLNGGQLPEGKTNPETYTANDEITLVNPEKAGSEFAGWTGTGLDAATTEVKFGPGAEGERAYEAQWNEAAYHILYDPDGGKWNAGNPNPETYTMTTEPFLLVPPVKEGFVFTGWTGSNGEVPEMDVTVGGEGWEYKDLSYKANWTAEYRITYALDGGRVAGDIQNPETYTKDTAEFTLMNPIREGFAFTGWSGTGLEGDNNMKVTVQPSKTTGNLEFTAHWEEDLGEVWNITYNLDGGALPTGSSNPATYTTKTATFTLTNPVKVGYTFLGWSRNGGKLETTATVETGSSGDLSFQAYWQADSYSISYDLNGGKLSGGKSNPSSYTVETETFTLNNPERDGYTFIGWTGTGISGMATIVSVEKGSSGPLSFKANWEAVVPLTGMLTLKNQVTGTGANLDKKFNFTVGISSDKGVAVNEAYECEGVQSGKIQFKNGTATVKLANEEYIRIKGIPVNYTVTVDQDAAEGYTTSPASRHASGTVTVKDGRPQNLTCTFINTKTDEGGGGGGGGGTGTVTPAVTSTANLTLNHVTNSNTESDKETKFGYTLKVTNGGAPLTGSYSYTGTGSGTVAFSSEGTIIFSMKDAQVLAIQGLPVGCTYAITKNSSDDGFTLTKDREDGTLTGNLVVTLTESKGDLTGTPSLTPGANGKNGSTDTGKDMNNVKTGDTSPIIPLLIVAMACLAVIGVLIFRRKRPAE